MYTRLLALIIALSIISLYGCASGSPTPIPTPAPTGIPTSTIVPQPTSVPSGSINISMSDYDAALAKWRAADVRDYKAVASYSLAYGGETSGQWTVRVRDGKIVEIYRGGVKIYVDSDSRAIPNPEINPDSLSFLTVESQFAIIEKLLNDPADRSTTINGKLYALDYKVNFNETLGYPELVASYSLDITDSARVIDISSLEVIEQGPNASVTVVLQPQTSPTSSISTSDISKPDPLPEVIIEKGSEESQRAYDEALAKWRATGIQEYEVTANVYGEGVEQKWTLHVNGSDVTLVSSTEGADANPSDLKGLWVEDQFANMASVLAGNDSAGVEMEGTQFYVIYVVNFDSRLSYPARFELRVKPGPVMDLGFVIEVESFNVIRKATP